MDPRIDAVRSLLDRHRDDLARALDTVPPALRDARPDEGSWSVAQIIEHLVMTERSVTKLLQGFVARASPRPPDDAFDPVVFGRELDLPLFLDRSRPITGPQPPGELGSEEAWSDLVRSREALLTHLEEASGRRLEAFSREHPLTGQPLNAYQWMAFLALHEGRHAEQIRAVVARLKG